MNLGKEGFQHFLQPVDRDKAVFKEEGYRVWCGTVVKGRNGKYYLFYSRWPQALGRDAWVTHSEVAYAISDSPYGGFVPCGIALSAGSKGAWDAGAIHNPTIIEYDGRYYLYYMGNYGNGEYWDHRNHQRIGVAVAENPEGPWTRFGRPVLDVTKGSFDHLVTSNPTVTRGGDGRFYMMYKAVSDGPLPKGGAVICGIAIAEHPEGPFVKQPQPVMVNPENEWSVEDPFLWYQKDRFYALVKDFQGYFTGHEDGSVALFESENGVNWNPAEQPLAFDKTITWIGKGKTKMQSLERPQLLLEDGRPVVLYCAAEEGPEAETSFNVAIPLRSEG